MTLNNIILTEIIQTQKDKCHIVTYMWNHLKKKKKKVEFTEAESRMVVTRQRGWRKWTNVGQKIKCFSYKMNKCGISGDGL